MPTESTNASTSPSAGARRSVLLGLIGLSVAGLALELYRWRTRGPHDHAGDILAGAAIWTSIGVNMLGLLLKARPGTQRVLSICAGFLAVVAIVLLVRRFR